MGAAGRSHEAVLTEAMLRVRADLAGRAAPARSCSPTRSWPAPQPATPSATSASAESRWSRPAVFDGVDYAALGHLHGRHTLTDAVRYCGSPLAYSFSEADHRKGSWLIDLGADGLDAAEFVDAPVPAAPGPDPRCPRRPARRPGAGRHEDAWVQATLTDDVRPPRPWSG